jgi:hypothetical protein
MWLHYVNTKLDELKRCIHTWCLSESLVLSPLTPSQPGRHPLPITYTIYIYIYVCMHVCMYVYIHVQYTYVYAFAKFFFLLCVFNNSFRSSSSLEFWLVIWFMIIFCEFNVCLCGRKCAFFSFFFGLLFCNGLIICETCHVKGVFFLNCHVCVCERLNFFLLFLLSYEFLCVTSNDVCKIKLSVKVTHKSKTNSWHRSAFLVSVSFNSLSKL